MKALSLSSTCREKSSHSELVHGSSQFVLSPNSFITLNYNGVDRVVATTIIVVRSLSTLHLYVHDYLQCVGV